MDTGRVSAQYRGQTGLAEGGTQWGREHRRGSVRTFPPDRWAILDFRPEFAPISILDSYSPSPDPVLLLVIHFEIRKDPKRTVLLKAWSTDQQQQHRPALHHPTQSLGPGPGTCT